MPKDGFKVFSRVNFPVRWLVLATVSSALLLVVIDMAVLYTALPDLTRDLKASASDKLWIMNAYPLTVAGLLPGAGALCDRFGARRPFLSGLWIFGLASLLAAFAPSAEVLIGGRVLLAVGAALMMPATLAIVRRSFSDRRERALAIGVWSAVASGGAAFGPVVGGALLEFFPWGAVFLINVPITVLAFILARKVVPAGGGHADRPFDAAASLQVMIGLVGVTYAIQAAGDDLSLPPDVWVAGGTGALFLVLFIRGQRRSTAPIIDFSLFRDPGVSLGVLAALMSTIALVGIELALSQRFQLVQGLTPLQAGLSIVPIPLAACVAGPLAGLLLMTFGAVRVLWFSLALAGLGIMAHLAGTDADAGLIAQAGTFVMIGAGIGAAMTAASTAIMAGASARSAGAAASLEEVSYELGGSIGIALLGSLLAAVYSASLELPAGVIAGEEALDGIDAALSVARAQGGEVALALVDAAGTAFDVAFRTVLTVAAALLFATSAAIALTGARRRI